MIHDLQFISLLAAYFCFRHFFISCSHIFCTNDKCFVRKKYKHNSLIFYSHWYARFNIEAMTFICCFLGCCSKQKKWDRTKEITQMILFWTGTWIKGIFISTKTIFTYQILFYVKESRNRLLLVIWLCKQ